MDYTTLQQQDLERRERRRQQRAQAQQQPVVQHSLKAQLLHAIKEKKIPRETPQQYVDRLWQEREELVEKVSKFDSYYRTKPKKIGRWKIRITFIEARVNNICKERDGVIHPGAAVV